MGAFRRTEVQQALKLLKILGIKTILLLKKTTLQSLSQKGQLKRSTKFPEILLND